MSNTILPLSQTPGQHSLGHDLLHVLGIELGVLLLLLARHVHRQELDLDVAKPFGQRQPEQLKRPRARPGPCKRIVSIRIPNNDRLDGHPGKEGAQFEAQQGLAVCASSLGEDQQRRPVFRGVGAVLDGLDGGVP